MTLRLTESELQTIKARHSSFGKRPEKPCALAGSRKIGTKPHRGMNKWEAQFSQTLEYRKSAGELVWWAFEPFRIRLAEDCWYRPDFVTVDANGKTEIYEVKGFMRVAARLRLKVAAEKLPYPFYLVRKNNGQLVVTPL